MNAILKIKCEKKLQKPGQSFKLRIYYIKEQVMSSNFGTPILTIWLNDVNGRFWPQLLASPSSQIEISHYMKYNEFRENNNIDIAIECFKKPLLW